MQVRHGGHNVRKDRLVGVGRALPSRNIVQQDPPAVASLLHQRQDDVRQVKAAPRLPSAASWPVYEGLRTLPPTLGKEYSDLEPSCLGIGVVPGGLQNHNTNSWKELDSRKQQDAKYRYGLYGVGIVIWNSMFVRHVSIVDMGMYVLEHLFRCMSDTMVRCVYASGAHFVEAVAQQLDECWVAECVGLAWGIQAEPDTVVAVPEVTQQHRWQATSDAPQDGAAKLCEGQLEVQRRDKSQVAMVHQLRDAEGVVLLFQQWPLQLLVDVVDVPASAGEELVQFDGGRSSGMPPVEGVSHCGCRWPAKARIGGSQRGVEDEGKVEAVGGRVEQQLHPETDGAWEATGGRGTPSHPLESAERDDGEVRAVLVLLHDEDCCLLTV